MCVYVPIQAFDKRKGKRKKKKQSQHQCSPRRAKKAKFSIKIFFHGQAIQNHLPFSAPRIFYVLPAPAQETWQPASCDPELALELISEIQATQHQAARPLSTDVAKATQICHPSLAAFLFSLVRSDVSLQHTESVWRAHVLERAVFLSQFSATICWLNPRSFNDWGAVGGGGGEASHKEKGTGLILSCHLTVWNYAYVFHGER